MALGTTSVGDPDWMDNGWQAHIGGVIPDDDVRMQKDPGGTADDQSLIGALEKLYKYELDVRRPRQLNWDRTWARFWNQWDFKNKRPWQSKKGLPHITIMALKFAWELIKPIILAGDKFFEVTTQFDPYKDIMNVPRNMVMHFLDLKGENRANSNFITALYDSYVGMILNDMGHMMVMPENEGMVNWSPDSDPFADGPDEETIPEIEDLTIPDIGEFGLAPDSGSGGEEDVLSVDDVSNEFRIRFEAINPRMVLVDSTSGSEQHYKIYCQSLTPWQFRKMANAYGWENVEEVIKTATSSDSGTDRANSKARDHREKRQGGIHNKYKCIEVVHIMGSPPDQNGELLFENKYCVWAGSHIVQKPIDLGLWHKRIPIVSAAMVKVPWAPYGMSLCNLNLDSQEARVELFNGLLDYLQQVINPPTEIDHNQLHPAYGTGQVSKGVYPGMTVQVMKQGSNIPAISRSMMQGIEPGVWQGLGWMKQEAAESTGLADTGAMPRTRNRISAKEFQERQAASSGLWQQIAYILEKMYVEPALEQAYMVALQCCTQEQWKSFVQMEIDQAQGNEPVVEKFKKMLNWGPKERWNKMAPAFRFRVKVYSAVDSRRENLEKVSTITEMAERIPGFAARVRWHKVGEMAMMAVEEDPAEMLWPDKGATAEQPMMGAAPDEGGMAGAPPATVAPPPGQESFE